MSVMGTIGQSEHFDPDAYGCAVRGVTSVILSEEEQR